MLSAEGAKIEGVGANRFPKQVGGLGERREFLQRGLISADFGPKERLI